MELTVYAPLRLQTIAIIPESPHMLFFSQSPQPPLTSQSLSCFLLAWITFASSRISYK